MNDLTTDARPEKTALGGRKTASGSPGKNPNKVAYPLPRKSLKMLRENWPTATEPVSGVSVYGFRYYVPWLGRWLSKDPIGERGGMNVYAIRNNSTINYNDIFGLCTIGNKELVNVSYPKFISEKQKIMQAYADHFEDAAHELGPAIAGEHAGDIIMQIGEAGMHHGMVNPLGAATFGAGMATEQAAHEVAEKRRGNYQNMANKLKNTGGRGFLYVDVTYKECECKCWFLWCWRKGWSDEKSERVPIGKGKNMDIPYFANEIDNFAEGMAIGDAIAKIIN